MCCPQKYDDFTKKVNQNKTYESCIVHFRILNYQHRNKYKSIQQFVQNNNFNNNEK